MKRAIAVLLLMLSAAADAAPASTAAKFRGSSSEGTGTARYAVRLGDESAVDDPALIARTLAATYGMQVETLQAAEPGVFTVTGSPSRARSLSADRRVASVEQLPGSTATPPPVIGADGVPYQCKADYRYDSAGNVIEIDRYAPDGSSVARTDHYVYDGVNRLVEATADTGTSANRVHYSYDRFGNIKSQKTVIAGTAATFAYGLMPRPINWMARARPALHATRLHMTLRAM